MHAINFIRLCAVLVAIVYFTITWILVSHIETVKNEFSQTAKLQESYAAPLSKVWKVSKGSNQEERCALCFFGLPRSYKSMVLRSIEKNILLPNARHNCDIFVHYFDQAHEVAGRYNRGGKIDPNEILLLERAAKNVSQTNANDTSQVVVFVSETDAQFWTKRRDTLYRYKNAVYEDGMPIYFPWAELTYTNSTIDNMVRQWHSIDSVFQLMEKHAKRHDINYTRVAMFRNDATYLTPIDIYMLDQNYSDTRNQHVVVPCFGSHPINDRMIYGPYEAIKIWSTKRFELIEERARMSLDPGFEMHSESFLNVSIFPAMEKLGYLAYINKNICFIRTRADSMALLDDCVTGGVVGRFRINRKEVVEQVIGRACVREFVEEKKYVRC
jgi:hypothetical protein